MVNLALLNREKLGADLVAASINELLNSNFDVLGDGDGDQFHMSKNNKPYFLIRREGYRADAVFVSSTVSKEVNTIMDALDGFPIRNFPVVDKATAEVLNFKMLCMPANPNSKYKSLKDKIAAIAAEKAAQQAEAQAIADTEAAKEAALQTAK